MTKFLDRVNQHQLNIVVVIAVSIAFSSYWFGVELPELYSLPDDYERNIEYLGNDMIVSNFGDSLSSPSEHRRFSSENAVSADNSILEIKAEIISKHVDTNEIVFHAVDTYFVDSLTKKHVDSDLYYAFPKDVEKKSYDFLHPAIHRPTTLIFKEIEKINTLNAYVFECAHSTNDNSKAFPQFSEKTIFVDYDCKVWVEPKTGDLLKIELVWDNYFVENGKRVFPTQLGTSSTSDYAVSTLTQLTKQKLTLLSFYEQSVPLTIVSVTVLIIIIQIVFTRLTSEKKRKEYERLEHLREITDMESQALIQKNLRKALDESSDVAITDKNGIITYVNDTFCKSSKYSSEELIGNTHRLLKSDHHPLEFYKNMWGTVISGKTWHDQIKNKAKDGTYYWNDMTIVPFLDKNNRIKEFISIRRDISEQIKFHDETVKNEKMTVLGELSSRLAHDIRNPLSIIQTSLENLKLKYGTDEFTDKSFDKIGRSMDRISHQMNDVLDFVRGIPPKLGKTKCSEIIAESLDSLTVPDGVKLILPKNDIELLGDRKQLSIVCNNLILNAIQAVDGKGTIEITVKENDDSITVQVKDSGKGILKDDLDKIFEPLFTTKQQGTGLGLASVKSIINAHGGTITVTSPPTTFTIILPKKSD